MDNTFYTQGSPLEGEVVPVGWGRMSLDQKRWALVRSGLALDFWDAASLLGKHSRAVVADRKRRLAEEDLAARVARSARKVFRIREREVS